MPDYKLTEAAKKDLRGISANTKKTGGREQEKAYREAIRAAALRVIAKTPKIGQKRDELTEGLRSFPVAHHIAYYVEKGDGIEVARILHPAMDREKAMEK
ncbi:MAG: type II toxin-antitoxin system RelE/ParE family toxin [Desulfobacterales bacterium]